LGAQALKRTAATNKSPNTFFMLLLRFMHIDTALFGHICGKSRFNLTFVGLTAGSAAKDPVTNDQL
jgi:hypothetical protein